MSAANLKIVGRPSTAREVSQRKRLAAAHHAGMPNSPDNRIRAVGAQQHGVVSVSQALTLGLSKSEIDSRARRGQYRRVSRGVLLVDAELYDDLPWLSRVQAGLLRHGAFAVAGLGTAACLLGIAGHDTKTDLIHIVLPPRAGRHQSDGIVLHFWDVPPASVSRFGSIRCTNPKQTMADLIPRLGRNQAVAALDSALHQGLLEGRDLEEARRLSAGRPGAALTATWWDLADGRSESPLESWARLDCLDHRLKPDELQWRVEDDRGILLGIADMAWLRRRRPLVGEADGVEPHSTPKAVFTDRRRANNFVGAGVDVVRFTWVEARRPGRCSAIVRRALRSDTEELRGHRRS